MNIVDFIGAVGVFQILLAYILNVSGKLEQKSLPYILLNTVGAAMACTASIMMDYLPFIILEAAWTIVSTASLIKYFNASHADSQ
ncbi:MAG TPA: hypothetical protein ENH91_06470 [Leeuwenhoekiella sp.]|nr:hypothetical protein [Leeuwenhoekiella sp.]